MSNVMSDFRTDVSFGKTYRVSSLLVRYVTICTKVNQAQQLRLIILFRHCRLKETAVEICFPTFKLLQARMSHSISARFDCMREKPPPERSL
ncbi:hypothetical protein TNCV_227191 [Trichonephila clavipes]|nr:hypothetical protein TNCV_227191 [Trichonephila clavipes]